MLTWREKCTHNLSLTKGKLSLLPWHMKGERSLTWLQNKSRHTHKHCQTTQTRLTTYKVQSILVHQLTNLSVTHTADQNGRLIYELERNLVKLSCLHPDTFMEGLRKIAKIIGTADSPAQIWTRYLLHTDCTVTAVSGESHWRLAQRCLAFGLSSDRNETPEFVLTGLRRNIRTLYRYLDRALLHLTGCRPIYRDNVAQLHVQTNDWPNSSQSPHHVQHNTLNSAADRRRSSDDQEISHISRNLIAHYRLHKISQFTFIQTRINRAHKIRPILSLHFYTIFPSTPSSSKWSFVQLHSLAQLTCGNNW